MLKELMSVKGLILLIALIALGLSITAVIKGCNDSFGDTCGRIVEGKVTQNGCTAPGGKPITNCGETTNPTNWNLCRSQPGSKNFMNEDANDCECQSDGLTLPPTGGDCDQNTPCSNSDDGCLKGKCTPDCGQDGKLGWDCNSDPTNKPCCDDSTCMCDGDKCGTQHPGMKGMCVANDPGDTDVISGPKRKNNMTGGGKGPTTNNKMVGHFGQVCYGPNVPCPTLTGSSCLPCDPGETCVPFKGGMTGDSTECMPTHNAPTTNTKMVGGGKGHTTNNKMVGGGKGVYHGPISYKNLISGSGNNGNNGSGGNGQDGLPLWATITLSSVGGIILLSVLVYLFMRMKK